MSGHLKSSYTEATLADTQSLSLGKINADEGLGNRQGKKGRRLDPGDCEENARRGEVLYSRVRDPTTLPFALSLVRRNG
ncbi:hypothetical protein ALC56_10748 [Trachymyrmex septentrionalis]|uniref:Uncharacterized protein n=1 Tax=Trachymyrmex septentrionalis TaxID=34720 RepID=A0A195F2H5_9HYME|nr:hypothetical protein ALC56_10748 [Trachymyrmex septentrionalis]